MTKNNDLAPLGTVAVGAGYHLGIRGVAEDNQVISNDKVVNRYFILTFKPFAESKILV